MEANNGRNSSTRLGKQGKARALQLVFITIQKLRSHQQPICVREISRVTELMAGIVAFSSHQTSQKMLWQFSWCQRVSEWLQGMCLHSNIWGLIINTCFFKRQKQTSWENGDYQTHRIFPWKYSCKKKKKNWGCFDGSGSFDLAFLVLSSLYLPLTSEILLPVVIGVSQILFPTSLIGQHQKNTWVWYT